MIIPQKNSSVQVLNPFPPTAPRWDLSYTLKASCTKLFPRPHDPSSRGREARSVKIKSTVNRRLDKRFVFTSHLQMSCRSCDFRSECLCKLYQRDLWHGSGSSLKDTPAFPSQPPLIIGANINGFCPRDWHQKAQCDQK